MLKESYLLECRYDRRVSFYGKARVEIMENGAIVLISYNTNVAIIKNNKAYINGIYSQTTLRHIKEFLKQHNFKAINKTQIRQDYLIEDNDLFYGLLMEEN